MTETTQLKNQIETAINNLTRDYKKTVRTVSSLKKKINDLELKISQKSSTSIEADAKKLSATMEKLDALVDSAILESAKATREYERLRHNCEKQGFEPAELKDLSVTCQKSEQLAKDLLCYSLGHLRKV